MAITGKYSFNAYLLDEAYAVIGRMNISESSAVVYFNVYASLSAYTMGNPPVSTVPLPMRYASGDIPIEAFEAQALNTPIFDGFEKVATEAITRSEASTQSLGASILPQKTDEKTA